MGYMPGVIGDSVQCSSERCKCEPCEATCLVGQYVDPVTCQCQNCTVSCDADAGEYYVYDPSAPIAEDRCKCATCDESEYNCEIDTCVECRELFVIDNKCECLWCTEVDEGQSATSYYGPDDCLIDEFGNSVVDTNTGNRTCQCGARPPPPVVQTEPPTINETDVCAEFFGSEKDDCGCCAAEYNACIASGQTDEQCSCDAVVGCDGQCGTPVVVDECGRVCPDNNLCEVLDDQFDNETFGSVCLAVVDPCGVCGGDGSTCLDCFGIAGGNNEVDSCGVCGGHDECTVVVATVTAVAGAVAAGVAVVAIVMAAATAFVIAAGILRRAHFKEKLTQEFDETVAEQLYSMDANPLFSTQGNTYYNAMSADDAAILEAMPVDD